jgi:hypothetical protein
MSDSLTNNSLVAGILGVLAAHLLSGWREDAAEQNRRRTQASRVASMLLNEVSGLRTNLRGKYFFIRVPGTRSGMPQPELTRPRRWT